MVRERLADEPGISNELREQLSNWEMFLNTFGKRMQGGLVVYNCVGGMQPLYVSEGMQALSGGFEDDFYHRAGESGSAVVLTESSKRVLCEAVEEAMEKQEDIDCVLRYYRTPIKKGWLQVSGRIFQNDGKFPIFAGLFLDVTSEKETEKELKIQRERYQLLEETADEILFEIDFEKDELNYSYKEMDGTVKRKKCSHYTRMVREKPMVHPDYIEIFNRYLSLARKEKVQGQLEYLTKIGGHGYEWNRAYYSSLTDDAGKPVCIIGRIKNVHDEILRRQKESDEVMMGLHSNYGIQQSIRTSLENAEFEDTHALAIMGIHHFRHIVEQNGVACGDAILHDAVEILQKVTKGKATLGRLGDGMVLLYFKNISEEQLDEIMEQAAERVEEMAHPAVGQELTCSIGVSVVHGVADYATFFQDAEEALHIAKITKGVHYIRV